MIRGENCISGTSTTGTGTLTLAATPQPPGGVDLYQWLTATGFNFSTGNAVLVPYTIIEYTSGAFATASQMEVGVGTLTLGASLTASTLARTTIQTTGTGLNSTATYNVGSPTAITIGTAANALVFLGANALSIAAYPPYFETSGDNLGVAPDGMFSGNAGSSFVGDIGNPNGRDWYIPFNWKIPMLVKRVSVRVFQAYSGTGTAVSSCYARIYQVGTNGRPSKLLYDFGQLGSGTNALGTTGTISSGASGNGIFLMPGRYFLDLATTNTGLSGGNNPQLSGDSGGTWFSDGEMGTNALQLQTYARASSATAGAGPDPANVTSYAVTATSGVGPPFFTLAPS